MLQPKPSPITILKITLPIKLSFINTVFRVLRRQGYEQLEMTNNYGEVCIKGISPIALQQLQEIDPDEIPDLGQSVAGNGHKLTAQL